jgi:hypothetical protein
VDSSDTNEGAQRPNAVIGVDPYVTRTELANGKFQFYTAGAYTQIAAGLGQLGDVGRNSLRAPGAVNCDLSIVRYFQLHERLNLEFRAEAFNIINHWNPGAPGSGVNSSSFGTVGSAAPSSLIPSITDPRVMQFALKLHW